MMLTAFARMGGIFITAGDLFACGKQPLDLPPEVAELRVCSAALRAGYSMFLFFSTRQVAWS